MRELRLQDWSEVDGISLYTDDLQTLQCFIAGPADSPYEGTKFPTNGLIV